MFFFVLLFSFPARILLSLGVQLLTGSFREGDEMLGDDMGGGERGLIHTNQGLMTFAKPELSVYRLQVRESLEVYVWSTPQPNWEMVRKGVCVSLNVGKPVVIKTTRRGAISWTPPGKYVCRGSPILFQSFSALNRPGGLAAFITHKSIGGGRGGIPEFHFHITSVGGSQIYYREHKKHPEGQKRTKTAWRDLVQDTKEKKKIETEPLRSGKSMGGLFFVGRRVWWKSREELMNEQGSIPAIARRLPTYWRGNNIKNKNSWPRPQPHPFSFSFVQKFPAVCIEWRTGKIDSSGIILLA